MSKASASGKIILFGEHAVVYGRPAIAVPVSHVRAQASVHATHDDEVTIDAPDIARAFALRDAPDDDPLATIIRLTCAQFQVAPRGFRVQVRSTIPVARGLGSGAAVSVAVARALADFFAREVSREEISALAYEVERLHHGTPSGIDNTVIAFEQPVYFVRGRTVSPTRTEQTGMETAKGENVRESRIESFHVARPFTMIIADTGVPALTKVAVGDVRRAWEQNRDEYETMFNHIGTLAHNARVMIEQGANEELGGLMTVNQTWLTLLGVSSPEIQTLVDAAMNAGARGAKLSGGGRGGNVIALVDEVTQDNVMRAMRSAGARDVMVTRVG